MSSVPRDARQYRQARIEVGQQRVLHRICPAQFSIIPVCQRIRIAEMVRQGVHQQITTRATSSICFRVITHAAANAYVRGQLADRLPLARGHRRAWLKRHRVPVVNATLRRQGYRHAADGAVRVRELRHRRRRIAEVAHDLRARRRHAAAHVVVWRVVVVAVVAADLPLVPLRLHERRHAHVGHGRNALRRHQLRSIPQQLGPLCLVCRFHLGLRCAHQPHAATGSSPFCPYRQILLQKHPERVGIVLDQVRARRERHDRRAPRIGGRHDEAALRQLHHVEGCAVRRRAGAHLGHGTLKRTPQRGIVAQPPSYRRFRLIRRDRCGRKSANRERDRQCYPTESTCRHDVLL